MLLSQSGAPETIDIVNVSSSSSGFKNSIWKLAFSPGRTSTTAFSAIIIPIDVLLTIEFVTESLPCDIAVKEISLKSSTDTSSGTTIFNSASIVLNAAKVTEPEGELSILIWAPQSLLV